MKKYLLLFLSSTAFFTSLDAEELSKKQKMELLFQKAFGAKTDKSQNNLFVPLYVNKIQYTEFYTKIDSQSKMSYLKQKDVKYLLSLYKKSFHDDVKNSLHDKLLVSLLELRSHDINITYNDTLVRFDLVIPPEHKKRQTLNFNRKQKSDLFSTIPPKSFSGGINLYLNQNYHKNTKESDFQRGILYASSELYHNFNDFVLQGRVRYKEDAKEKFTRDSVQLSHDDENKKLRYTIGDIYLPHQTRLSNQKILGFSAERHNDIGIDSFTQNVSRISNYEFFLKDRSNIKIYINDRLDKELNLNAGTYNLYDLNIPIGVNKINLKITEISGKTEELRFDDFNYHEILQSGQSKFGMAVGVLSNRDNLDTLQYQKDKKIASFYYNYGLTNTLSISTGAQLANDYHVGVIEFYYGTTFGLFDAYYSLSNSLDFSGDKSGVNYRTNISILSLYFSAEKIDHNYMDIVSYENLSQKKHNKLIYNSSISMPLIWQSNLGISGSRTKEDLVSVNNMNIHLNKRVNSDLNLEFRYDYSNTAEKNIYFVARYNYGQIKTNYMHQYDKNQHNLDISYQTDGRYNMAHTLNIDKNSDKSKFEYRGNKRNEKYRLDVSYGQDFASTLKNASIQLGTGIAFAGKTITITEPITSSFLIVENDEQFDNSKPGIKGYQSIDSSNYQTFAMPIADYRSQSFEIEEANLPLGVDLERSKYKIYSKYKTGIKIDIKAKSFYSVEGTLYDQSKKPVANRGLKVLNLDSGTKEMTFTNEMGYFVIENIEPGAYNVILSKKSGDLEVSQFTFNIKQSQKLENLIDLGAVSVKLSEKREQVKYFIYTP